MSVQAIGFLRKARLTLAFIWREYQRDRCGQAAAALAFGTLLSLVPLAALLGWLVQPFDLSLHQLFEPLGRFFSPTEELREAVQVAVERYSANAAALGVLGLGFFLFVAYGMLAAVESTMNDIWRVKRPRGRIRRLAHFWIALLAAPLLFFLSAVLNQVIERAFVMGGLTESPIAAWLLGDAIPFVMLVASASIIYGVLPHRSVKARPAILGGAVLGVLYHFVRWLFALYVGSFATYDRIYGILGVIPAFLVWLFLIWSVFLLGAEVAFTAQHFWDEELPP